MQVNDNVIQHLAHKLFVGNPDGKKFLELMKEWHANTPTYPCDIEKLKRHGGAVGWAGFRSGQLDFMLRCEIMAHEYELKVQAESKKGDKTT